MTPHESGKRPPDALTPVDEPLQCPAASVAAGELDDAEGPAVQAFIETLARIAHAVAVRKANRRPEDT